MLAKFLLGCLYGINRNGSSIKLKIACVGIMHAFFPPEIQFTIYNVQSQDGVTAFLGLGRAVRPLAWSCEAAQYSVLGNWI